MTALQSTPANAPERHTVPELRLAIAGLGTVGCAVIAALVKDGAVLAARAGRPLRVIAVSARDRSKDRGLDLSGIAWHEDPTMLAACDEVDLIVEVIGGEAGAAKALAQAAFAAGKPLVTANKALLARHGLELAEQAEKQGVSLNFEAAIAGGIPIVKTLREALIGNRVKHVYGILNGTCNYILTRMEQDKIDFAACLREAQRLGYAEADPTFDVDGFDTAHKLALLTTLAFGTRLAPDAVYVEGIRGITPADIEAADELGYRIKLLGVARLTQEGIEQRVHPTLVPKNAAIARIGGVLNAVAIDANLAGEMVLAGAGAGGNATASAILADIVDIARGVRVPTFGQPAASLDVYRPAPIQHHEGGYFIRLSVKDRPGAFAAIATSMAQRSISLKSIVQRRGAEKSDSDYQPVMIITHETCETRLRAALDDISNGGVTLGAPRVIRIEMLR